MKKLATFLLLLTTAVVLSAAPQQETLRHTQSLSASVGRHAVTTEHQGISATVSVVARHPDGKVFYRWDRQDLRVNAGTNWQADLMGDTSTPSVNAQCNYIALTDTAISPAATDTTLSGEITTNGLSRAQGTYTHTSNASSYTEAHTWTATAAQSAQAAGMFTAASSGTMCFENTFTSVSLDTNDTLTLTWTINF